jgi:hypothetical protein
MPSFSDLPGMKVFLCRHPVRRVIGNADIPVGTLARLLSRAGLAIVNPSAGFCGQ